MSEPEELWQERLTDEINEEKHFGDDVLVGVHPRWRDEAKRLAAERDAYRRLAAQLCDDFELEFGLEVEDFPVPKDVKDVTPERLAQVDRLAGIEVKP